MKVLILTASPNEDGLTATCGNQAYKGVLEAGSEAEIISLNDLNLGACQACGNGWGTCLKDHECQVEDDFQKLHSQIAEADGIILISPVYWGEMSESAKAFTDRVRRCEALSKEKNAFEGKPLICVAAAGGTGNGVISCLASMERFGMHVRVTRFDYIGITRNNREYKLEAIYEAAKKLASSNA